MNNGMSRRDATQRLFLGALAGSFLQVARGQERRDIRDLVARVQDDLERAADFTRNNEKERERYHNAQHHLSEFDRKLRDGHFDKDKLDEAIDDLKNLVANNTLESRDRDQLGRDLADLRVMRDTR